MVDRKKICKCGDAVGSTLIRTHRLEGLLERIKFEESSKHIPGFKESINYIYGGTNNIGESCTIDTAEEQNHAAEAFEKIDVMGRTKNPTEFYIYRNDVLDDLSKIRNGISDKIRLCSI